MHNPESTKRGIFMETETFFAETFNSPKNVCLNNLIKEATVPAHVITNITLNTPESRAWNNRVLLTNPLKGGIPEMERQPTKQAAAVIGIFDCNPPRW
jgi:hypothetical protein